MITFYPGPSKLLPELNRYWQEGYEIGIFSQNHRSKPFMQMMERLKASLAGFLGVPKDYEIIFTSSATECWEIIAQSFVQRQSHHIGNGAFGEKWFQYTQKLVPNATYQAFEVQDEFPAEKLELGLDTDVICITQNETSNGTEIAPHLIADINAQMGKERILAVDATSSLGGRDLPIAEADVWFASIQKCFGLPPGLAIMICSPKALAHAEAKAEDLHYNSFGFALQNFQQNQTPYTPNIPGLYLLYRSLTGKPDLNTLDQEALAKWSTWQDFLEQHSKIKPLTAHPLVQSKTVMALETDAETLEKIFSKSEEAGFILGKGYGPWKATTFRVANFPAITLSDLEKLLDFLDPITA